MPYTKKSPKNPDNWSGQVKTTEKNAGEKKDNALQR